MQTTGTSYWVDPRRWAALVRAYALFLVVATIVEYNNVWHFVLAAWLPNPKEAADAGILLQPMKLGIFLLPLIASQLMTAGWLLLVRARPPREDERAFQITREVLAEVWKPRWAYRNPRILIGAVAQPHLVSLLGKPFLILPRQGLALFEHELGPEAETAFRSVVAHEAGHLESWDDLLYFPWFAYTVAGFGFCAAGLYLAGIGRLSFSQTFNHLFILAGLGLLGFYVVRRREAYSDTFSVVALGSVKSSELALRALGRGAPGRRHRWGDTHFDVDTRLALLAERGKPFLDMSRVDLGVAAFIYFSLSSPPLSDLAAGGGPFWILVLWLDDLVAFSLTLLLLLMIGGLSLARGGRPVRIVEVGAAGALCLVSQQISAFLQTGAFNLFQTILLFFNLVMVLIISLIPFVLVFRVLNLWAISILGRPGGDPRERLAWGALGIVGSFTVVGKLIELGMFLRGRRMMNRSYEELEAMVNASTVEQIRSMLPLFLFVLAMWLSIIALAVGVAAWSWLTSQTLPDLTCLNCGTLATPYDAKTPRLAIACANCGTILRPDLMQELPPEVAT